MSPISALKVSLTPFRTHESIRPISSPVVRFAQHGTVAGLGIGNKQSVPLDPYGRGVKLAGSTPGTTTSPASVKVV